MNIRHRLYGSEAFLCRRNGKELEIQNIKEVKRLLREILQEDKRKIRYIIEKYPYERLVECVELNGRCFTEEALLENNLEISDLLHIVELIPQLIEDLEQGRKRKLWDKLQEDVFELRLHVSANRIFRLLFVQEDTKSPAYRSSAKRAAVLMLQTT